MKSDPYERMKARMTDRLVLFMVGMVLMTGMAWSQNITETQWYFGNSSQNLVFDLNGRGSVVENNQATPFGQGGSAVITDQFDGSLLFYSDGNQVFDGTRTLISSGLNGDPTLNVPVVTAPVSGNMGEYYLFTNSGTDIEVSIADANTNAITSLNQVVSSGLTNPAEGMIVIPLGDGVTFWLITQDASTFNYQVTLLDGGGIGATTTYNFIADAPNAAAAHFSFNQDSSKIAVAPQTANRNIRILDFDVTTGVLSFDRVIQNTGYDDGQGESVYDLEWSNDGSKLYISRYGSAGTEGNIYQYDFADAASLVTSILPSPLFRSYGLQTGLDGRIYHLYQETGGAPFLLGRINEPDSLVANVAYEPQVFTDDFNGRQFPAFADGYLFTFNELNFTYLDSCQNDQTKFFPIVDPVPHQYFWGLGDGTQVNSVAPIHTYDSPGTFNVTLRATINGISQAITQPVTIGSNSTVANLGNDTTICINEILILDAGDGGSSYLWSTGGTGRRISVDTAGTYWVEKIGPEGCPAYDEIVVSEYGVNRTVNNQWYFGQMAGIDFTDGASAITDENMMSSAEGCASISDTDGNLLFYTNGSTVWNKDHLVMQNGTDIGGDETANQSAIIMPFSGETTMFYIFTTEEVPGDGEYQFKVSVVDMKADSARGRVALKGIAMNNSGTEKISATSVNGPGWVMTHEAGSNVFRTNFVGPDGILENVFSPIGEVHDESDPLQASGAVKFSNGARYIAAALPRSTGSFVELFDFDQGTGEVSNSRLIDLAEPDPVYGVEFSSDLSKVYLTTLSAANSKLIQLDLDSIDAPTAEADITSSKFDGYPTGANYGTLQTGPDGVMYMAVDGSTTLGTLNAPNVNDAGASFDPAGFDLLTRTSGLGLPNFGQEQNSTRQEPGIVIDLGCYGQPTRFSATGRDSSIEIYTWFFGDGTVLQGQDTVHTYAAPGTYTVQLLLSNRCDQDTSMTRQVVISALPETPQVPLDTTICDQPITLSAWPVDRAGYSYFWSTGDTTRTIQVAQPSIIRVYMTDPNGCRSEEVFSFVADGRPEVDLGYPSGAAVFCQDDSPPDLNAGNPGASYEWAIDGAPVGNNITLPIDTSTPGQFLYTVAVTDPLTMCIGRDTVDITVLPLPDVTFTPTPTGGCGLDDGAIQLDFNVSGNYDYQLQGPTPRGPINVDGPTTVNETLLAPGNYTAVVTNTVTGCVLNEIVQVEDPTANLTLGTTGNCDGQVELTINYVGNYFYDVYQDGTIVLTNSSGTGVTVVPTLFDPGTLDVEVRDNPPNCVETETVTVAAGPEPAFTFDAFQEICGTSGNVFVVDGSAGLATYNWTGPGIVGVTTGVSVEVDQSGIYQVTASQAGFCDRVEDIEVTLNDAHDLLAEATGDPCDGEIRLSVTVSNGTGPYSYLWNTGEQTQAFTTDQSGTYSVVVRDQSTNCEVTSNSIDVTVEELLEVQISATPNCNDGSRIFLEAITTFTDGVTYQWEGPSGPINSGSSTISASQEGDYTVTVTNPEGTCTSTDTFTAIITPITDEDLLLPSNTEFCSVNSSDPGVLLDPGAFNTYEWTRIPDPTVISTDRTLYVTQRGTYRVVLYNGFTCTTDQVVVRNDCSPEIIAPTAFSPNGDGLNDTFSVIPNPEVLDFKIVIHNRWGEPLFKADDMTFEWDGKLGGKLLPPGTYTYIMTFSSTVDTSIGEQEQYGAVVLVR